MVDIPTASSVLSQQNQDAFNKDVLSVLRAIEKASANGDRQTTFNPPSGYRFYDAVKDEFLKKGYSFKPTGYIGGVWQHSERICW